MEFCESKKSSKPFYCSMFWVFTLCIFKSMWIFVYYKYCKIGVQNQTLCFYVYVSVRLTLTNYFPENTKFSQADCFMNVISSETAEPPSLHKSHIRSPICLSHYFTFLTAGNVCVWLGESHTTVGRDKLWGLICVK